MADSDDLGNLILQQVFDAAPMSEAARAFAIENGLDPEMPTFVAEVPDILILEDIAEFGGLAKGKLLGPFGIVAPQGMVAFRVVRVIGKGTGMVIEVPS